MEKSKANKEGWKVFTKQLTEWQNQMGTLTSAVSKAINDSIDVVEKESKNEAYDNVIKMLRDWNCQNNPKIRTTINTLMMRVGDLKRTPPSNSANAEEHNSD